MLSDSFGGSSTLETVTAEPHLETADALIGTMRHIFALRHTRPCGLLPEGPIRNLALETLAMAPSDDPVLGALRDIITLHVHGPEGQSPAVIRMSESTGNLHIQDIELQRRGLNARQRRDVQPWMRFLSAALTPASASQQSTLTHS